MKTISKITSSILVTLVLAACGCKSSSSTPNTKPGRVDTSDLTIACPIGAPAMALYNRLFSDKVEINKPDNVQTWLSEGKKDIVIAPTNAGVAFINAKKANYKLAATVTFGNFFIASTGHNTDNKMDKDNYVVVFQQNNLPDKLFKYIYGSDYNVHYVADNGAATRCLISGVNESDNNASVDYVLVAQPSLMRGLKQNQSASLYANLQDAYKEKANCEFTQASIFVNNSLSKEKADSFLDEIKEDVETLIAKPEEIVNTAFEDIEDVQLSAKLSVGKAEAIQTIKDGTMGLSFKYAKDIKPLIDAFMVNLSFGNETSEEIYY